MMGRVLYAVVYDSGTLYAAGIDSTFAFSKDGGKSWTVGDTGFEKPDLFCIDFVGAFGLAAGSGGHVIKTSDGGATWREVEVPEKVWQVFLSGLDLKKNGSGERFRRGGRSCGREEGNLRSYRGSGRSLAVASIGTGEG